MANASPYRQRRTSIGGSRSHPQTWPPPDRTPVPAMIESSGGRHRREDRPPPDRVPRDPTPRDTTSAEVPAVFPPHPALVSGGWYRNTAAGELPGPGRYPVDRPVGKSIRAALVLSVLFGPLGICYTSVTAGLIATGAMLVALLLFGFLSLIVVWPLAVATAVASARMRRRRQDRT